jgi:hypothetical protein
MSEKDKEKTWLTYVNLSDSYERKARFLPGVLSVMVLVPVSAAFEWPLTTWLNLLIVGVGSAAVVSVGISHLASAAGNHLQEKLWPRWPYDAPTNVWLHPDDNIRSTQQKEAWYAAIKRLSGLDIPASFIHGSNEIESVINDAVSTLRYRMRNSEYADRLVIHNTDYGFIRNFTGLRPIWLIFSALSCGGCWYVYFMGKGQLIWGAVSTMIFFLCIALATFILPRYVKQRARHYAESFFGALIEYDRNPGSQPE